jgi:hypothetical protein
MPVRVQFVTAGVVFSRDSLRFFCIFLPHGVVAVRQSAGVSDFI